MGDVAIAREVDVASRLLPWLAEQEWEVHQEVMMYTGGRRADIVAVRGALLWVIEVKQTPGLALLDQGLGWIGFAHYVSVAAPRHARHGRVFEMFCRDHGLGFLLAGIEGTRNEIVPRLNRKPLAHWLRGALCEETRSWAKAGNALSEYYSPFRRTVRRIQDVLKAEPGLTMRDLITKVGHHYNSDATARGAIRQWIQRGKIQGIRGDGGRPEHWYLA